MKGRLVSLSFAPNGKQQIILEVEADFRKTFDELKDKEIAVEIKRYRKKRSLDANAYAWVLIDKIAKALSTDKTTVYREAIRDIGGVSEIVCAKDEAVDKLIAGWEMHGLGWQAETAKSKIKGCTNVILYYGSSTYDTAQMALLIDRLVQDAENLGIETKTPKEIAKLKEGWL